jgi:hypothetical protein
VPEQLIARIGLVSLAEDGEPLTRWSTAKDIKLSTLQAISNRLQKVLEHELVAYITQDEIMWNCELFAESPFESKASHRTDVTSCDQLKSARAVAS